MAGKNKSLYNTVNTTIEQDFDHRQELSEESKSGSSQREKLSILRPRELAIKNPVNYTWSVVCICLVFGNVFAILLYGFNVWLLPVYERFYGDVDFTLANGSLLYAFSSTTLIMTMAVPLTMKPLLEKLGFT